MEHRSIILAPGSPVRQSGRRSVQDRDGHLRAHDIRGIVSCLALVADELSDGGRRGAVLGERVRRACDRLLQISGATAGRSAAPSTLSALLDDVAALTSSLAGARTRIEIETCDAPVRASAEVALFRILLNLASNAVRATNSAGGGCVRIHAELGPCEARIEVANDGAGLLGRGSDPCRGGARTGLGLVIAEALAEDLGGCLLLRSGRPGGTRLRLVLPISVFSPDV